MIQFIYRWKDPRIADDTLCTKYVGITMNPNERLAQHQRCDGNNFEKDDWMQELKDLCMQPVFEIIDIIYNDNALAYEREKLWIEYYINRGCELTNIRSAETWRKERNLPTKPAYSAKKHQRYPVIKGVTNDF